MSRWSWAWALTDGGRMGAQGAVVSRLHVTCAHGIMRGSPSGRHRVAIGSPSGALRRRSEGGELLPSLGGVGLGHLQHDALRLGPQLADTRGGVDHVRELRARVGHRVGSSRGAIAWGHMGSRWVTWGH
eukprot:2953334-Prymnesium_polylepis.1